MCSCSAYLHLWAARSSPRSTSSPTISAGPMTASAPVSRTATADAHPRSSPPRATCSRRWSSAEGCSTHPRPVGRCVGRCVGWVVASAMSHWQRLIWRSGIFGPVRSGCLWAWHLTVRRGLCRSMAAAASVRSRRRTMPPRRPPHTPLADYRRRTERALAGGVSLARAALRGSARWGRGRHDAVIVDAGSRLPLGGRHATGVRHPHGAGRGCGLTAFRRCARRAGRRPARTRGWRR